MNAYLATDDWQGKAGRLWHPRAGGRLYPVDQRIVHRRRGLPLAETAALLSGRCARFRGNFMNRTTIILDHIDGVEAAASWSMVSLTILLIDGGDAPRPGTIFRAICDRPLKGQGGMMLRLPDGDTGFLRAAKGLAPGQPILVQVTGYADEGKAVPVTHKVLFKSRYAIVTPGAPGVNVSRSIRDDDARDTLLAVAHSVFDGDHGLILRSSCDGADAEEIAEDIEAMLAIADHVMAQAEGPNAEMLNEGDGPHVQHGANGPTSRMS